MDARIEGMKGRCSVAVYGEALRLQDHVEWEVRIVEKLKLALGLLAVLHNDRRNGLGTRGAGQQGQPYQYS